MSKFGKSTDRQKLRRQHGVRLPDDLDTQLTELCRLTTRSEADVIRAAVRLLFENGVPAAHERLSAELKRTETRAPAPAKSTADHAAELMPLESDHQKSAARGKRGA